MGLKNHVGKPLITGTFYVYDDEGLEKKQINPTIFSRLEKTKAKLAEAETVTEEAPAKDAEVKDKEDPAKDAEVKADEPTKESKEKEKSK